MQRCLGQDTGRRAPAPLLLPPLSTDQKRKALHGLFTTLLAYGMVLVAILLALLSAWVACKLCSLLSSWSRADAEIVDGGLYSEVYHNYNGDQTRLSPVFGFHSRFASRRTAVAMSHKRISVTRSRPRPT